MSTERVENPLLGGVAVGRGGFPLRAGSAAVRNYETHPAAARHPSPEGIRSSFTASLQHSE